MRKSLVAFQGTSIWLSLVVLISCSPSEEKHPYEDITHYSNVFGREKYYRLYRPHTYIASDTTRYPVIYFFHGWGGRYKSDDNAKLAYDSLQKLVDKYQVLLVMWDGNVDEKEPRPYNIGNHDDVRYEVQMKDYFPELVHHIDSTYRTRADKTHRGIIGFSMGGFMSYFISGKYPDMIGAAVGMTGSPEFFVGYPGRHTLYPLRYTFENLREVKLRFHNSTADELTYLNTEVKQGADWDGNLSFDYWQFEGGHMVDLPGETRVFDKAMDFVVRAFHQPLAPATEWSHYDLYPSFEVYGYRVKSNIRAPGFVYLRNVKPGGFGITTKRWLPDGPPLDSVRLDVTTAAVYTPNAMFHVVKLHTATQKISEENIQSDDQGQLHLTLDGEDYELGITPQQAKGNSFSSGAITFGYEMKNGQRFLRPGNNQLRLLVFDRDPASGRNDVTLRITSTDSALRVIMPAAGVLTAASGKGGITLHSNPIDIRCDMKAPDNAAPPFVHLRIGTTVAGVTNYSDLVVPVLFDAPVFESLQDSQRIVFIDDKAKPNDSTEARGQGNGDGIVQPGERIAIYTAGHPLKLYSENKYVVALQEETFDIMVPAKWPDGFTFGSVMKIADDCPSGTEIELLGNYETKEFMPIKRSVHWGKVRLKVSGKKGN